MLWMILEVIIAKIRNKILKKVNSKLLKRKFRFLSWKVDGDVFEKKWGKSVSRADKLR